MIVPDIDHPDLPLQSLFDGWPETATVFLAHRMLCFGCPIAPFHTVIDACLEYRLDETGFRRELHAALFAPKT
jgi:hybrid cluster-associated redox disulfide protein